MDIQKRNELAANIFCNDIMSGCDLEIAADDALLAATVFMECAEKFDASLLKRKEAAAAYESAANAEQIERLDELKKALTGHQFDPINHFLQTVLRGATMQKARG